MSAWNPQDGGEETDQGPATPQKYSQYRQKMLKFFGVKKKIKRACLVFLFPKILVLRFHMWSRDLLPGPGGICGARLQAAGRGAHPGAQAEHQRSHGRSQV